MKPTDHVIRGLEHSVPLLTSGEEREEIEFNHQLAKDAINHVYVMTTPQKKKPRKNGVWRVSGL